MEWSVTRNIGAALPYRRSDKMHFPFRRFGVQ
jgi:hypothetical protein